MALKNSQYYALMREYEQTRLKNHDLQMKRYEEVYKKLPNSNHWMNRFPSFQCSMAKKC